MKNIIVFTISIMLSLNVNAATFCVTDSAELQTALTSAGNNGQNDLIKISIGTYISLFDGFKFQESNDLNIEITGGWTPFLGSLCSFQIAPSPFDTIIDGNNLSRALDVRPNDNSDVIIKYLTFMNGINGAGTRGAGLKVAGFTGYVGNVTIESNAFLNNNAPLSSALDASANKLTVINNLFDNNHASVFTAVSLLSNNGLGVYFINNTVINNTLGSTGVGDSSGLAAIVSGTSSLYVANNIFYNNETHGIKLSGDGYRYLFNNNIVDTIPAVNEDSGNFSTIPEFETGALNYTPALNSPLIDAGIHLPENIPFPIPFKYNWNLTSIDINGADRVQVNKVDIGAYESPPDVSIFINGFE